jgi:DNA polymerase IIIc chi subunit
MDMPTKHVRSIAAQRERSQEGLVVWCLPQLDKKNLWTLSAKSSIPHVAYHLENNRDHECMNWLDNWEDGEGCVTNKAT